MYSKRVKSTTSTYRPYEGITFHKVIVELQHNAIIYGPSNIFVVQGTATSSYACQYTKFMKGFCFQISQEDDSAQKNVYTIPQCACAARVTAVSLSVYVCVCLLLC